MKTRVFVIAVAVAVAGSVASAQELAKGQILDDVQCTGAASQHYALYLPSNFSPDRKWPVILGFDAGGRGRRAVERYQEAAEKYGYIVAGSNNSRNGPWEVSLEAARAMTADVENRFPIDRKRIYTAGMSGGARVAMMLALLSQTGSSRVIGPDRIAGVLASSAGFPDDFHESVAFPIFGSAGTNDFNHEEMIQLNRGVKTPHRLEVFEGTHEWLPVDLATDGVEWMELQGMKTGARNRDEALIDQLMAKRLARADGQKRSLDKMLELQSMAADFDGLRNVAAVRKRAAILEGQLDVKTELAADRNEEDRELKLDAELYQLRDRMNTGDNFARLKTRVMTLLDQSKAEKDSSDRRIARRILAGFSSASRGIQHPELQALLNEIRSAVPPVDNGAGRPATR